MCYFIAERSLTVSLATANTPLPRWWSVCGYLMAASTHACTTSRTKKL